MFREWCSRGYGEVVRGRCTKRGDTVMKKSVGQWMVACVASLLAAGSALAIDGTVLTGGQFAAPTTWVGGVVPGGPGSTLYVRGNYGVTPCSPTPF